MENKVINAMIERRSVRAYKSEQIKDEQLEAILQAGMYAPTGRGKQSPIMIVVQDKETIDVLRKMNAEIMGTPDKDPFYNAPTVIIVLANKDMPTYLYDGSLVMGNLMNGAYAVGVDSCWIHRAKEEFESEEGKALLKKWGVEGNYEGIGHCILGYHVGNYPVAPARKENYIFKIKNKKSSSVS